MTLPARLIKRVENAAALDRLATPIIKLVGQAVRPRLVRNALSGTNLGHPLHPMLTDVPIGAWSMSALVDLVGAPGAEQVGDSLILAGVLAAVPTAAAGLNDWSDTYGPDTRVGLVHAAANTTALVLYAASLAARRTGRRQLGRQLGRAGLVTLLAGGYLGGHLSFVKGVNVNHTAFEDRPADWTPVIDETELTEGQPVLATANGMRVLLVRDAACIYALSDTCTHMGGPLHEGQVADGCVTCPWHGSVFRLADGEVHRGPASSPQPTFETRVAGGRVEVRAV